MNGSGNLVNGYIRPLSVENNHKTNAVINNLTSPGNSTTPSSNRINDFKSPHSQSSLNLDSSSKKTKNFLNDKPTVNFFY